MREEYKKIEWNDEDIIAFSNQNLIRNQELVKAFKESINYSSLGDKLKIKLREIFNLSQDSTIPKGSNSDPHSQWFEEGIDCKIVRAYDAKGWRKGKIRIQLNIEFELWEETEESDSPLDNFREK